MSIRLLSRVIRVHDGDYVVVVVVVVVVAVGLHLKGIEYEYRSVNLVGKEQVCHVRQSLLRKTPHLSSRSFLPSFKQSTSSMKSRSSLSTTTLSHNPYEPFTNPIICPHEFTLHRICRCRLQYLSIWTKAASIVPSFRSIPCLVTRCCEDM